MGLGSELFALLTQSLQPGSCKKLSNETAGEKHSTRTLLKKNIMKSQSFPSLKVPHCWQRFVFMIQPSPEIMPKTYQCSAVVITNSRQTQPALLNSHICESFEALQRNHQSSLNQRLTTDNQVKKCRANMSFGTGGKVVHGISHNE